MDNRRIARQLVKLARELEGSSRSRKAYNTRLMDEYNLNLVPDMTNDGEEALVLQTENDPSVGIFGDTVAIFTDTEYGYDKSVVDELAQVYSESVLVGVSYREVQNDLLKIIGDLGKGKKMVRRLMASRRSNRKGLRRRFRR